MLEYYVLIEDINRHKLTHYNIFQNARMSEFVESYKEVYEKDRDKDALIKALDRELRYTYRAKTEYEIVVTPLIKSIKDEYNFNIKVDVYYQLRPNVEIIADIIIQYWNL